MEQALPAAADLISSSRHASPAQQHIRDVILEDTEIRDMIEEIDEHPDIQWLLPKFLSTAGSVLQHSIRTVKSLINAHGPVSFKIGITHNAIWR